MLMVLLLLPRRQRAGTGALGSPTWAVFHSILPYGCPNRCRSVPRTPRQKPTPSLFGKLLREEGLKDSTGAGDPKPRHWMWRGDLRPASPGSIVVVLAPANRHGVKLFEANLEARRILPPVTSQHLGLDKGYDSAGVRETAHAYLFTPHIHPIGEEPRRMERNRTRRPYHANVSGGSIPGRSVR